MFRTVVCMLLLALLVSLATSGRATLYQPDDPLVVPVATDGTGAALPFDDFKLRLLNRMAELNPAFKDAKGVNAPREAVLQRIAVRQRKRNRDMLETVALATDLLRVGKADEAESVLASDRRGYLPNATLAHICAARNEWAKAMEYLSIASEERPPTSLKGLSTSQLAWELNLTRGPLMKLYEERAQDARRKIAQEDETFDDLFGVKFLNEAGQYEPGKLAEAERKKLPGDAIAIVQQMLLWSPTDARLYWLLGELYAATGQFAEAKKVMDECVSEARQFGNRKLLMDHRTLVRAAAEAQAEREAAAENGGAGDATDTEEALPIPDPNSAAPISLNAIWLYFGVVALVVVLAVVRRYTRKSPGGRALRR